MSRGITKTVKRISEADMFTMKKFIVDRMLRFLKMTRITREFPRREPNAMKEYANVFHDLSVDGYSGIPHVFDTLFIVSLADIFGKKIASLSEDSRSLISEES